MFLNECLEFKTRSHVFGNLLKVMMRFELCEMLGKQYIGYVPCCGCELLGMWNGGDMACSGCRMLGMWDVKDVGC